MGAWGHPAIANAIAVRIGVECACRTSGDLRPEAVAFDIARWMARVAGQVVDAAVGTDATLPILRKIGFKGATRAVRNLIEEAGVCSWPIIGSQSSD